LTIVPERQATASGSTTPGVCYLCGNPLEDCAVNNDHVPPKQFYPKHMRRSEDLQLLTLPVHVSCNTSYQRDEDYFVQSLGPLASDRGTVAGKALWLDLTKSMSRRENQRLTHRVLDEFSDQHNGIYLPPGLRAKSFDTARMRRMLWKIVRGLHFHEYGTFLPEDVARKHLPIGTVPEMLPEIIAQTPKKGSCQEVFAYVSLAHPERNAHIWALLFWGAFPSVTVYQHPACDQAARSMQGRGQ